MRHISIASLTLATVFALAGCAKEESPAPADEAGDNAVKPSPDPATSTPAAVNEAMDAVDDAMADAPEEVVAEVVEEVAEPSNRVEGWSELFNNVFVDGDFYSAGVPTEEGLRQAASRGVTLVISLLPEEQQARMIEYDLEGLLEELGVRFERIPVTSESFSSADVRTFAELMDGAEGPVLTHCGSANRVGAMWAAYLNQHKGEGLNQAIEAGQTMGLRSETLITSIRRMAAE